MALLVDVLAELTQAGEDIKKDLWQPGDAAVLQARAQDIVQLGLDAAEETDAAKKAAFLAAAKDVLNQVKMLAVARAEVAVQKTAAELGQFFLDKVAPKLVALLPALVGL